MAASSSAVTTTTIFGRRLKQARERACLAQDQLGVLAGLDEASSSARMSRYENGIHEPQHRFVEKLARVLKVEPAFFYCADDTLADIVLSYSALKTGRRKELAAIAKALTS